MFFCYFLFFQTFIKNYVKHLVTTIVMKEHGEIESKIDKLEEDEMPSFEDCSDVEYPVDEEALVIRKSLNVQDEDDME